MAWTERASGATGVDFDLWRPLRRLGAPRRGSGRPAGGWATAVVAVALVAGTVPLASAGVSLATVQTSVALGNALGPVLGGAIVAVIGFRSTFLLASACLLLSGIG